MQGVRHVGASLATSELLNFFQFNTVLTARVPRVRCDRCGVHPAGVPWARPTSGFTLLFEAMVLELVRHMPVAAVARIFGEHDTRLWRVIHHYVDQARARRDDSNVTNLGIDETSSRKGHQYISIFVDLDRRQTLFATPGKDAATVERFREDLIAHGGSPDAIAEVCTDMSNAFIKGVSETFPRAQLTFDKFHLTQVVNKAVDKTRRAERAEFPELKGQRYALLRNPETMNGDQLAFASKLLLRRSRMKTAKALHLRLVFQELFDGRAEDSEAFLTRWCDWAQRSRVPAMIEAARTMKRPWRGILRWFHSRINNVLIVAINSLIQAAKAKARGYRTSRNLIAMVYLVTGKLDLHVTHAK